MTDISILPEERGAQRFIGRGALLFVLIVGLLPNLFFLVVMPFFIAERLITPLLYVTAAIAALFLPRFAVYALFFIIAVIDLCLIVMVAFHLPLALAIDSVRYMATIDVSASSFYVAVISINLALALVSAWLFDRTRTEIRLASPLPVLLVALSLMAADFHFNFHYFTKSTSAFDSAGSQNGLGADAVAARGGNLLIVMVEGLGAFADPAEKKFSAVNWKKPPHTLVTPSPVEPRLIQAPRRVPRPGNCVGAGVIIATISLVPIRTIACRNFFVSGVTRPLPIMVTRPTCLSDTLGTPISVSRNSIPWKRWSGMRRCWPRAVAAAFFSGCVTAMSAPWFIPAYLSRAINRSLSIGSHSIRMCRLSRRTGERWVAALGLRRLQTQQCAN